MAETRPGPLEGIRVIDLADEKGELCGRLLADLGAEVVRAEPSGGANSRRLPPFVPGTRQSLYFAFRNANKRGVTLDLEQPGGPERLRRLLEGADVLIESFAPGSLDAAGLAPAALIEADPGLVVTSISDFGQTGPHRDYLGTDMLGFASGGMMHRAGAPHRPPLVAPGALAYDAAGVTAAFATLLACYQRLRYGRGQHIDVSVQEAVANLADWSLPGFSQSGQVGGRAGAGIYPLYRCADGWVRIILLTPRHWHAMLEWMGDPEELRNPEYEQFIARLMNREAIDPVLGAFFLEQKKVDAAREAQRRGITITPLLEPGEVLSNEHTVARATFRSLEILPGVSAQIASGFLEVDGERMGPRQRAPSIGEHDDQIPAARASGTRPGAAIADAPADPRPYPFAGLRVLDFGGGAVGVEVGRLLAEYGAEVIKIETRTAPDFIRVILAGEMNPAFASSSRSKQSLGVNCKTAEGLRLVRRLAESADVAIENNGTGVMDRLGLGPEALHEINPRIIYFSSHLAGSHGPWKNWIGYGPSTHALSGLQYLWNHPDDTDTPAGSTNVHPDHLVGRFGALGVTAGLIERERTDRGLHLEVAQFEAIIGLLGDWFARESLAPGSVRPLGNTSERGAPWGAFPCKGEDEWCAINVRSDAEWRALSAVMGEPDWAKRPAYDSAAGRIAARDELEQRLAEWTAGHKPVELMHTLQAARVPAAVVQHPRHQLEDPHLAERRYHRPIEQPPLGRLVLEGPAFRGSQLPEEVIGPAPALGEHTREIAGKLLGLSDSEIDALISDGVLEVAPPAEADPA